MDKLFNDIAAIENKVSAIFLSLHDESELVAVVRTTRDDYAAFSESLNLKVVTAIAEHYCVEVSEVAIDPVYSPTNDAFDLAISVKGDCPADIDMTLAVTVLY